MNARRLCGLVVASFIGGCATEGGGVAVGVGYDAWYYDDWYGWYGGAACCVDWPDDIGPPPHPAHPIAGDAPRPSHPIANVPGDGVAKPSNPIASQGQPKATASSSKTMSSPRPAAMPRGGGGMRGGGGRR